MRSVATDPPLDIDFRAAAGPHCSHCGALCPSTSVRDGDNVFCCNGCRAAYATLQGAGLDRFYDLAATPGVPAGGQADDTRYAYLDEESIRRKVVDGSDGTTTRVTFHLPSMHCIACVWLLENLHRADSGILRSRVQFARREVTIWFSDHAILLSRVAALLASMGYEPVLNLDRLDDQPADTAARRLYLQLGVAGFAFGNIMILSLAGYFGMDHALDGNLPIVFRWASLALAVPVLLFSASDYLRAAWRSLRDRSLSLDVPIAIGALAVFLQSATDIVLARGDGYLDSFAGLIFFLLCGKLFQRRTFDRLSFDRDYRSYFPLSVARVLDGSEAHVPITQLRPGDRIRIRNAELVPADSVLEEGEAAIDYSFVTGEADPVTATAGEYVYAGGRQRGGGLTLRVAEEVSQSYLTSLWSDPAFDRDSVKAAPGLAHYFSRFFTPAILLIATVTAATWLFLGQPAMAVRTFAAVLIVACPCALALASPFTLGAALRVLGRRGLFLRDAAVVEALARIDTIVFDKTGTLTRSTVDGVQYQAHEAGACCGCRPAQPSDDIARRVRALARGSTHPAAMRIAAFLGNAADDPAVNRFREVAGRGIEGEIEGARLQLGSPAWLGGHGVSLPEDAPAAGNRGVHLAVDDTYAGTFLLPDPLRARISDLLARLAGRFRLAVISGDHDGEAPALRRIFGPEAEFKFRQQPADKLAYIESLKSDGGNVAMIGDGLNDAGALAAAQVGIALTEDIASFSPACDGILSSARIANLDRDLDLCRASRNVIRLGITLSMVYNAVGIGFAAQGLLSPLVCAILMPLSSISVVVLSVGLTSWLGRTTQ